MNYILFVTIGALCTIYCNGLMFQVQPNQKKCIKEEIHKDVLVTGEYELSDAPEQAANLRVLDSKGHILYQKDDVTKGKFAFTTEEYDMFEVCFETRVTHGGQGINREVSLTLKHGIEAKNYDDIAKAEQLKPLEVELKRLEDLSDQIVSDFKYMRKREEEMRDTNESTHSKVFYFSLLSMGCLLGLATWQVLYLRRFFKSKKLID